MRTYTQAEHSTLYCMSKAIQEALDVGDGGLYIQAVTSALTRVKRLTINYLE